MQQMTIVSGENFKYKLLIIQNNYFMITKVRTMENLIIFLYIRQQSPNLEDHQNHSLNFFIQIPTPKDSVMSQGTVNVKEGGKAYEEKTWYVAFFYLIKFRYDYSIHILIQIDNGFIHNDRNCLINLSFFYYTHQVVFKMSVQRMLNK